MLYGPGAPGGTINYVTQKPTDMFQADLRAVIGNYDRRGGSAAVSGPLLDDGAIAYRIAGYYEDRDQFRDYQSLSSTILDAGLRFGLAPATTLTLQATYTRQNQTGSRDQGESIPTDPRGHLYGSIKSIPPIPRTSAIFATRSIRPCSRASSAMRSASTRQPGILRQNALSDRLCGRHARYRS